MTDLAMTDEAMTDPEDAGVAAPEATPADPAVAGAPPSGPPSLRERVLLASDRVVGASERTHLVSLLRRARSYRLAPDAAAAVARTVRLGMADVEVNVDLVPLAGEGVWIEYPDAPRRIPGMASAAGTRVPCDVGVLVSVDPDNTDRYIIVSAWDFEPAESFGQGDASSVRHAYAAVAVSRTDAMHHAYAARNGKLEASEPPFERLMGLFNPYLPPGLRDEMLLAGGALTREDAVELDMRAVRDVLTEAPFAIAALLLLSSLGRFGPDDGGLVSLPAPGRLDGIRRWYRGTGFRSSGRPDPLRTRLSYVPPRELALVTVEG